MDRIHRLGQRRPVKAIKLVVEDSIESRIVQVSGRLVWRLLLVSEICVPALAPREEVCYG